MLMPILSKTWTGNLLQQICGWDPERVGELFEDSDGRIPGAVLNATDVGLVQTGFEGELLLGPALFQPVPPDVPPDLLPDVHGPEQAPPLIAGL